MQVVRPEQVATLRIVLDGGRRDAVNSVPALRHARRTWPGAHIVVEAAEHSHALLKRCPHVDAVDRPAASTERGAFDLLLDMRRPDAARDDRADIGPGDGIVMSWSIDGRDSARSVLRPRWPQLASDAERMLRMACLAGGDARPDSRLALWATLDDRNGAARLLRDANMQHPIVVVHPFGCGRVDSWGSVLTSLVALGCCVVVVGTRTDIDAATELAAKVTDDGRIAWSCGATTDGELVALLEQCAVFVGSPRAPALMACAVGARSVVLASDGDDVPVRPVLGQVTSVVSDDDGGWLSQVHLDVSVAIKQWRVTHG